jgi:hypothetical protein
MFSVHDTKEIFPSSLECYHVVLSTYDRNQNDYTGDLVECKRFLFKDWLLKA